MKDLGRRKRQHRATTLAAVSTGVAPTRVSLRPRSESWPAVTAATCGPSANQKRRIGRTWNPGGTAAALATV
jgi:hypothetical protein